jgi:hypothetical protein
MRLLSPGVVELWDSLWPGIVEEGVGEKDT